VLLFSCHSASSISPGYQAYHEQRKCPSRQGINLTITCAIHVLPLQMDPVGNLALFACCLVALFMLFGVSHMQKYAEMVN
jgi:hypothetical protein